jgi:hypothetical protein
MDDKTDNLFSVLSFILCFHNTFIMVECVCFMRINNWPSKFFFFCRGCLGPQICVCIYRRLLLVVLL